MAGGRAAAPHSCAWRLRATQLEQEQEALRQENQRLRGENEQLRKRVEELQRENQKLAAELVEARRAAKRQAAPFSKGEPKATPRKPGRRAGREHGRHGHREVPPHVDRVVKVVAESCGCGSRRLRLEEIAHQYQAEIPKVRPYVTRFDVHISRCEDCGARVQPRHPEQTSDALGAAASQLGPNAIALAAQLKQGLGLSYGKVAWVLAAAFGLVVTAGGLCLALQRAGRRAEPTYQALIQAVRGSVVVTGDETGWKVAARHWWLWVFVSAKMVVYAIRAGRGFEEAASVLGVSFAGILVRDGWAPYRSFIHALHQTCLRHLLRRCKELLEVQKRGAARFPHAVKRFLLRALELRDKRDRGELSQDESTIEMEAVRDELTGVLRWQPKVDENRKLAKHLNRERDALLTFLEHPGVPATNYLAEQALRGPVATRKVFGGNRTATGAGTQEILSTLLGTSRRQQIPFAAVLVELLCAPAPRVSSLLQDDSGCLLCLAAPRRGAGEDGALPLPAASGPSCAEEAGHGRAPPCPAPLARAP